MNLVFEFLESMVNRLNFNSITTYKFGSMLRYLRQTQYLNLNGIMPIQLDREFEKKMMVNLVNTIALTTLDTQLKYKKCFV